MLCGGMWTYVMDREIQCVPKRYIHIVNLVIEKFLLFKVLETL